MPMPVIVYAYACILGAGIVRGFSGFGFSLLSLTSLSLVLPPAEIVPAVFLLELAASLHLLPSVWHHIHWRAVSWLSLGCLVATPPGVLLLARLPAAPLTLALAVTVLLATILLARGYAFRSQPGHALTFTTGAASGFLNGSLGIGGPPVILFFFSSPAGAAAGRASMIAYFLMTDVVGLGWQAANGLLGVETLRRALWLLPAAATGVWVGNHSFRRADPGEFRRWVLRVLGALALISGARALTQLL